MKAVLFWILRVFASIALLFFLWMATAFGVFAADQKSSTTPAIAFASSAVGDDKRFRLWLDFDKPVVPKAYVLNNPRRLIVDLPEVVFSLGEGASQSRSSLVEKLQFGTVAPGRSRVVLSLNQPVMIKNQEFKQGVEENRHRFVLDIVVTSNETFEKAAIAAAKANSGGKVAWKGDRIEQAKTNDRKFTIVIDPGHGGIDGGAVGKGKSVEKNITLSFAKSLKAKFADKKKFRVVLTREADVFVQLDERLNIARRNKADLMISIHADSLRQSRIRGATIYTLSREGTDELSRQLAEKQNRADLIAGLDLPEVKEDVSDILIDLTRRETEAFSVQFAKELVGKFQKGIKLIKNPHRGADFFVLRAAEVPSVLLELGYLSNRNDERLMRSKKWQNLATELLADAILAFFETRSVAQ